MSYALKQVAAVTLDPGAVVPVVIGLTAALFVDGSASQAQPFSVQAGDKGTTRTIEFIPNGNGTVTTWTADLEASADGGVTWVVYPNGSALTFSSLAAVQVTGIVAGLQYRLNSKTFSLGTATSVWMNAVCS